MTPAILDGGQRANVPSMKGSGMEKEETSARRMYICAKARNTNTLNALQHLPSTLWFQGTAWKDSKLLEK